MRNYFEVSNGILKNKIVAILRVDSAESARQGALALKAGGVTNIEVTIDTPGALEVINELSKDSELFIGAGTVIDEASCRMAIMNGARYIVTPNLNESVIKCANRYQVPITCGCFTPSEMAKAMELGANFIKLFPASQFDYGIIKALKAPFPQLNIGPTGGVSLNNIKEWNEAGADFFGIGGEFTALAKEGKYDELTEVAKKYVKAIN